jgi:hypothetical protein
MFQLLILIYTVECNATLRPPQHGANSTRCCCFSGDACWPSAAVWSPFDQRFSGRLIQNIPLANVWYNTEPGSYRARECERLRSNWFLPKTHLSSLGSVMSTFLLTTAAMFSALYE